MIERLIGSINSIMLSIGYLGLMIFMFLESTMMPIPSEVVMPFAGYLIAQGNMNFFWVVVLTGIASLLGSLFSYGLGYYGGIPLIKKVGHYVLLDEDRLRWTEVWFRRYGDKTIFISRFVPVIRHLISLPAGIGKMNIKKFSVYTLVGATMWNTILVVAGYYLGKNYILIHKYSSMLDYVVVALLLAAFGYYVWHLVKILKKRKGKMKK
ncbi:MAG: DedA family protein [Candidatus Woesearchaeota archaeon]|nr:DedA family protein [Candidatus Woesearchaeota archaeon]